MKFPTMIKKVILRILCKNHNFWTTSSYEKPSVHFYPVFHFAPVSPNGSFEWYKSFFISIQLNTVLMAYFTKLVSSTGVISLKRRELRLKSS